MADAGCCAPLLGRRSRTASARGRPERTAAGCCALGPDAALLDAPLDECVLLGLSPGVVCRSAPTCRDPRSVVRYRGPGPWSTCSPRAEMPPRLAEAGLASGSRSPPATLTALLERAAREKGGRDALLAERPVPPVVEKQVPPPLPRAEWATWTYRDYLRDVQRVAQAFLALGLQQFGCVNTWGFNAPEWHLSALAAMLVGAKCAGIYPTDAGEAAAYKVVHSCGVVVVAEDASKLERLVKALSARGDCRRLRALVTWGVEPPQGESRAIAGLGAVPLLGWRGLLELGGEAGPAAEVRPGQCAALIYTSGTTGDPKAVMISHDNIVFQATCLTAILGASCRFGTEPGEEERVLSYLPLSHVAGMVNDIVMPIVLTATMPGHMCSLFARPYDIREKSLSDRLSVARPTFFSAVPLIWQRLADGLQAASAAEPVLRRRVAGLARGVALEAARRSQLGGDGGLPWGLCLAERLVLSRVKARLGLDCCKFGITGAAPIRRDSLEFFASLGLQLNEVYGMSECAGACTMSTDQAHEIGSVGWEMPGFEVKVFDVDPTDPNRKSECPPAPSLDATDERYQGELCLRGRTIMMGYMACPDLGPGHEAEIRRKTAEAIDDEGWLHSGDRGLITTRGMVRITGRYKELIIGEGGENIAPVPIEESVKRACEGVSEVMLVGDKRKYNVALVTLKAVGANGELAGSDRLDAVAQQVNPDVCTISDAIVDQVWIDAVAAAIDATNADGQVCRNNAFKIRKFTILPTNFSEEGGELTPTKKLKRRVVESKYAALIERIYATNGVYIKYSLA